MTTKEIHQRYVSLDIAKAICIILMVAGHSGCPKYIHDVIYLFHMPAFFLISGMLLSEKYSLDLRKGVKKKFKSYYIPYVKWSIVFILAHNILYQLNFYSNSYSLTETILNILLAITMMKTEMRLGGYWFLSSLLWASIASILYVFMLNKYRKLNAKFLLGGVVFSLLFATIEALFLDRFPQIKIPSQFDPHTVMAFSFFIFGYMLRRNDFLNRKYVFPFSILLLIPVVTALVADWSMDLAKEWTFIYFSVAVCGAVGLLKFSQHLAKKKIANLLTYIGYKTLYILTFHFLCFKPLAWVYLKFTDESMERLNEFPNLKTDDSWMWVVSVLSGIILPLFIWEHCCPV